MTALTAEATRYFLEANQQSFIDPLPLEDTVKAYKGGLAGFYFTGATAGEVAPFKVSANMVGIGRFRETVDNADDGQSVGIEAGVFQWTNAAAGNAISLADFGKWAYGVDDNTVGKLAYTDESDPRIHTITPVAADDTQFALAIEYKKPGETIWRTAIIAMVSDASATATEICDGLRTSLVARTDLTGVVTGTGTTTLVLTGGEGVEFKSTDIGAGVLAVVETEAGTLTPHSKAGLIVGYDAKGPKVFSHPSLYNGFIL